MGYDLTPEQWSKLRVRRTGSKPRRVVTANRKGGSGKSTTAVHIGAAFAQWGARVRLTDGDAQLASATYWLRPGLDPQQKTLLEVFVGDASLVEATLPSVVDGMVIVPSLGTLAEVESKRPPGTDTLLAEEMDEDADKLDLEMLDSAPNLGLVSIAMLAAATDVLVLVTTSTLDMVGASEMDAPMELVRKRLNKGLQVTGVVMVDDNEQTVLSQGMVERFTEDYPDALVHQIPHSVRVREAPGQHETLFTYAPKNPAALAYWELAAQLVPRLGFEWEIGPEDVKG